MTFVASPAARDALGEVSGVQSTPAAKSSRAET